MLASIRAFAASGKPTYAECGGLMYLASAIVARGQRHRMLDLVAGDAVMSDRLEALGYVEVETREPSMLGPAGTRFRGHQFRYSRLVSEAAPARYALQRPRGEVLAGEGYGSGNVLASYVHAHWSSNPDIPRAFAGACVRARSA
jgi:cobyrinic acid a,c-diamide synthase